MGGGFTLRGTPCASNPRRPCPPQKGLEYIPGTLFSSCSVEPALVYTSKYIGVPSFILYPLKPFVRLGLVLGVVFCGWSGRGLLFRTAVPPREEGFNYF